VVVDHLNYRSCEQIILTLTYLRHLTTFQLLGIQFGVSETLPMISLIIGFQ